ncbi:ATP-binding protein [Solirubrobacter ginsenosidimutans]|uniref:ATP-binding protein n=1 Tax=Solirubrobacter ginsenosidimutans TaxID=490573 RepID=A0A9X3MRJ5_9ACTN|nr:ATP-binding protein [Solirubrobacter ginsenosidimutans]MDA0161299.1 ATP-binding protein [Solirubrobacter ginsenosidimutans]
MTIPPAEGERRAQLGLVPQYKIAAEKIYALLLDGGLHELGIADPEAKTLDDIQLVRQHRAGLILDAYQVKWGHRGGILAPAELADLLKQMIEGRKAIIEARKGRVVAGAPEVVRVVAHLYTSDAPSTFSRAGDAFDGGGRSLHKFIEEVWKPAERQLVSALNDVDLQWHVYLTGLAETVGLGADDLLAAAPDLRIHTGQELREETIEDTDWSTRDSLEDLVTIRSKLQDLVSSRDETYVWLTTQDLLSHLGEDWQGRWHPRLTHEFPTSGPYEPLESSIEQLEEALDRFDHGYIGLTGSPGAGKSTLLTRLLRADRRVAARYYAYVPDSYDSQRGEATAFLHDLYLAITERQGRRRPAPRSNDLGSLHRAFREELSRLGTQAREKGQTEILLIDGLDHVRRDPLPHHSLLKELPAVEEIPDGVLFVIGTRSLEDLPKQVSRGIVGERHVEVAPLPRAAVISLAEQEGLGELGDDVTALSGGHPLLARTYLELAKGLAPRDRRAALAALPAGAGDVWEFYDGVWETVSADPDLVGQLGMVSRMRGTIRLAWLAETGSSPAEIERLRRLDYLFAKSGPDRWTFFHSSFREYLKAETAEVDGQFAEALHRKHHADLAARCRSSSDESPERFDVLFHLLESGHPKAVLREATPEFFRHQVDGLRARADVQEDIQMAALALGECHVPIGVLNLALSAHELQVRGYQFPEDTDFLRLLVAIDQPELAIAHLGEIDNGTVGHDRIRSAMQLAMSLHKRGFEGEALRVFDVHEPLDWLGGRAGSWRESPRGNRPALWGWARTAAILKGPQYVVDAVRVLRPPTGRRRDVGLDQEELDDLRWTLLRLGGEQLLDAGKWTEAEIIHKALLAVGPSAATAVALFELQALRARSDACEGDLSGRQDIDADSLPPAGRLVLAALCLRDDDPGAARALFQTIANPDLPSREHHDRRDRRAWEFFHAYHRLAAKLDGASDPVTAVPAAAEDYLGQTVVAARHVVVLANLDARPDPPAVAEIEAALRSMHAFWATRTGQEHFDRPAQARTLIGNQAVAIAKRQGSEAVSRILDYFQERWTAKPSELAWDGVDLLRAFSRAGVGKMKIRALLKDLEDFIEQSESSPEQWIELGLAWSRFGDCAAAVRCCNRAVGRTLSLSSEKDLQLRTWTKLVGPLLDGPDGERLTDALVEAFVELDRVSYGGSPDLAAKTLINGLAKSDPLRAWSAARRFLEHRLLEADEVLVALLSAAAQTPSEHWWVAMTELLAVYGVDVPRKVLAGAVASNGALAKRWLPHLVERVAVEGRPTWRRAWREVIRDRAEEHSIEGVHVGPLQLTVTAEAPARRSSFSEDEPEEEPTIESALARLEAKSPKDFGLTRARWLIARVDELDEAQLGRLSSCVSGTDEEAALRAALAQSTALRSDIDRQWEEGVAAINCSRSGDWSRQWGGGPILDVIPKLQAIDRELARSIVYRRFSELAYSTDSFLGSVAGQLDDYLDALELPAEETARAALAIAAAVLRDVTPLPDSGEFRAASDVAELSPANVEQALELTISWLLASPYVLAWQSAQRALLALLAGCGAGRNVLRDALTSGNTEVILRACAVIETALDVGLDLTGLADELAALVDSDALSVRLAGCSCLAMMGISPPAWPAETKLPAGLRLELPAHPGKHQIVSGIRAKTHLFRREVETLAAEAGVDEDALYQQIVTRTEQVGGPDVDDYLLSRTGGIFGFGFLKPSAAAVRTALDEAAAKLVDARRAEPADALSAAGLWPMYDSGLLADRPARRPQEVLPLLDLDERQSTSLYKRTAEEIASGASDRLAVKVDGWTVLGESTELWMLGRLRNYENRVSGVLRPDPDRDDDRAFFPVIPWSAIGYDRLRASSAKGLTIMRCEGIPMASPDGWLALHPGVAAEFGLTRDLSTLFGWTLDGNPAVRSVWWRSGFRFWPPYSEADEVGEGWLVLASPALMARLADQGKLERLVRIWTGRRGDGDASEQEHLTEVRLPV